MTWDNMGCGLSLPRLRQRVKELEDWKICTTITLCLSKEGWKSNSQQYGQMKSREDSQRRKSEKRREEQVRESEKNEDAGARKGKVAKDFVFPMICGPGQSKSRLRCGASGGSKTRLAKATGAEPAGQMKDEKLHAVVAQGTFPNQQCGKLTVSDQNI